MIMIKIIFERFRYTKCGVNERYREALRIERSEMSSE